MKNNDWVVIGFLGALAGWMIRGQVEKKRLKTKVQSLQRIEGFNQNLQLQNKQKVQLQNDTFRTCIL